MDSNLLKTCQRRARVIKALAHPSRLFMVDRLSASECCVHELTELVGCDMSTVSKHLSVLKNAGIVSDEKRGSSIYYTLRVPCIVDFLRCADAVLSALDEDAGRKG